MKLAVCGLICSLVAADSANEDIEDNFIMKIGVGLAATATIDCSKTFECKFFHYDPVCGSDGFSYSNECEFISTFCSKRRDVNTLFIQAKGECFDSVNKQIETSPVVAFETVFCSLRCNFTPDKVCGTDGVTYINDCHLLSSKCEHPELEKASHGECKEENILLNEMEANVAGNNVDKCKPMCKLVYDPLCGSDGITYANPCLLQYAQCQNPNVKVVGAGECPPHIKAASLVDAPSVDTVVLDGQACIPKPCPYIYAPVCGSDGQTHENLCLFANARCLHPQQALVVVHDGECDAETQLMCDTMTCPLFTECKEQFQGDGTIVAYCADVCAADRCSEREDCKLVDVACYSAPCPPIAICTPKNIR